jgi:uncharacterized protein YbjT (DUF2867 family)
MRILVTGAYGLLGSACLAALYDAGYDLVAAGRSIESARRRFAYAHWIEADFGKLTVAAAWMPLLAGIDAVVNCVASSRTVRATTCSASSLPAPWRCSMPARVPA